MNQADALSLMKLGFNIFLTGAAGAGKSYVLNQYIDYLRENKVKIGVSASTGIAATRINGTTIHSWSGIGIRESLTKSQIDSLLKDKRLKKRLTRSMVLIIDEISMLHPFQLDMVDQILRRARSAVTPFGGMQVIFCGDFFQLPPVTKEAGDVQFAFSAPSWIEAELKAVYLHEQHRQTGDELSSVLNDVRRGTVSENTLQPLRSCYRRTFKEGVVATRLYTHNIDVDRINHAQLEALPGDPVEYTMTSEGPEALTATLKKNCLAPEKLMLKENALVMCVRNNFEKRYVNGSIGKVIETDDSGPVIKIYGRKIALETEQWQFLEEDTAVAKIAQIPLRLAWAITIHKSQGMSLDAAEMDLSKCFVAGMGYVALSRVRTLEGLSLLGLNPMALRIDERILRFDEELQALSKKEEEQLQTISAEQRIKLEKKFLRMISEN